MGPVVPHGLVDGEPWLRHRGLPLVSSETSETTETGSAGVFVVSVVSEDGCKGLTTNRGEAGRPRPWGSREGSGSLAPPSARTPSVLPWLPVPRGRSQHQPERLRRVRHNEQQAEPPTLGRRAIRSDGPSRWKPWQLALHLRRQGRICLRAVGPHHPTARHPSRANAIAFPR